MKDNINSNTSGHDNTFELNKENIKSHKSFESKHEQFWINNPSILFRKNNFYKIIPTKKMTKTEVLNTLTRLFIYLLMIYIIFYIHDTYIFLLIIGIIIIVIIYFNQNNDNGVVSTQENYPEKHEKNNDLKCQLPSKNNPFMNISIDDNPNRLPACNISDEINNKIFEDVNDVYDRRYSQRQFYTLPITTIPNDQTSFAKWLYGFPETCKENQTKCFKYEDLRHNR